MQQFIQLKEKGVKCLFFDKFFQTWIISKIETLSLQNRGTLMQNEKYTETGKSDKKLDLHTLVFRIDTNIRSIY